MKIHKDDFEAGANAEYAWDVPDKVVMSILEAAFASRRARKAAKRERQRKEKDKQVVESVKPADDDKLRAAIIEDIIGNTDSTPSKAHEWDGNASAFDAAMNAKA